MIKLAIKNIIEFYDGKNPNDRKHSSSITGIAGEDLACCILQHYFENKGYQFSIHGKPTEGIKKGKWLDRWIRIEKDGNSVYYQTEIKNWCAHSLGGKPLTLDANQSTIENYASRMFARQWNKETNSFKEYPVKKVLKTMKSSHLPDESPSIEPLICYWFPINNGSKDLSPFFTLDCKNNIDTTFDEVHVFSMSLYLRELVQKGISEIIVESQNLESRFLIMQKMFEIC